jgi:hypothetical protein
MGKPNTLDNSCQMYDSVAVRGYSASPVRTRVLETPGMLFCFVFAAPINADHGFRRIRPNDEVTNAATIR